MDDQGYRAGALAGQHMRAVERLAPHRLAPGWADRAANGLFYKSPALSAKSGLTAMQRRAGLATLAVGLVLILWAPGVMWTALQLVAASVFLVMILFRLAAAAWCARPEPSVMPDEARLPVFTILAPVYREAAVLPQLTRALASLDYPPGRLDIKIIMEADDHATIQAARQLVFDSRFEIVIVPEGTPRTKPRALNYALTFARGDIVTVYDAEDVPHPGQLRAAAAAFLAGNEKLGCVQAPLNWYNHDSNWLTRQFAIEYAVQFRAILPLLARLGLPLPLGGTSNHFRREALEAAGGWDAYNVTEDADLGFRLARLGYRSGVITPPTLEEAPEHTSPWIRQRSRWLKGYIQTLAVHLRHPLALSPGAAFSLAMTIGTATMSALLHGPAIIALTGLAASGMIRLTLPAAGFLCLGYAASMVCGVAAIHRAGLQTRCIDVARIPLYWPLQTIAAIIALVELRIRPYFWAKTEHGFTRAPEPECRCPLPSPSLSSRPPPLSFPLGRPARNPIRQKVRA